MNEPTARRDAALFGVGDMDSIGIHGAVQKGTVNCPDDCDCGGFTPAEAATFMEEFLDWLESKGLGFGGGFGRGEDWPYAD